MASLAQHNADCLKWLGETFEPVNIWMDELFATYGSKHRKHRHHKEGIEEARTLFGDTGALAAAIHILRDCRSIPLKEDYERETVDSLGIPRDLPFAEYMKNEEQNFEGLVKKFFADCNSKGSGDESVQSFG
jgi:hypothetical protein